MHKPVHDCWNLYIVRYDNFVIMSSNMWIGMKHANKDHVPNKKADNGVQISPFWSKMGDEVMDHEIDL